MRLSESENSKVVVIGIGNKYRSDDGAGLLIANRLKEMVSNGAKIVEHDGEFTKLIDSWENMDKVIIVDATSSGNIPGTISRFDVSEKPLPSNLFHYSTHSYSIAETIELARTLNKLPGILIVYGIEGKDFTNGTNLSTEVAVRIDEVVSLICKEIEN